VNDQPDNQPRSVNWTRAAMHPDLPVDHLPLLVLVCLAAHANAEGSCFPSESLIAAMVRRTERRVQIALGELEAASLIVKDGRGPGGGIRRRLTLPAYAFEPVKRDLRKRPRGATPASPSRSTGNIDSEDVVILDEDVHPFRRRRSIADRGDAHVAPTGDAHVAHTGATPTSPGATPASDEGRRPHREGATPTSPEVGKYQEKQSPAAADAHQEGGDEAADRMDRLAAWVAGGGRLVDGHGKELTGEIDVVTRGQKPAAITANMIRWGTPTSPLVWPTAYAKRLKGEADEAAKQQARAENERRMRERAALRAASPAPAPERRITAAEVAERHDAQRGPIGAAWRRLWAALPADGDRRLWIETEKVWPRRVADGRLALRTPTPLFADTIRKRFLDQLIAAAASTWPEVTAIEIELAGDPLTGLPPTDSASAASA
jgi:hypothetical protein